jgi:hypothetical protein
MAHNLTMWHVAWLQTRLNELQAARGRVTKLETERGQLLGEMEGMTIRIQSMRVAQEKVRIC